MNGSSKEDFVAGLVVGALITLFVAFFCFLIASPAIVPSSKRLEQKMLCAGQQAVLHEIYEGYTVCMTQDTEYILIQNNVDL